MDLLAREKKIKEELKEENLIEEEKIKVTSLEIIVTGTKDKPYFEIKYKEVGKEYYNIGYSSYDLNNVFGWKEECFEIVNQVEQEYNDGWIPCSERLPNEEEFLKDDGRFIVTDGNRRYESIYDIYCRCFKTLKLFDFNLNGRDARFEVDKCVIAWQPLPEPYEPKGE